MRDINKIQKILNSNTIFYIIYDGNYIEEKLYDYYGCGGCIIIRNHEISKILLNLKN